MSTSFNEETVRLITELVTNALKNEAAPVAAGSTDLLAQYPPYDQTNPTIFGTGSIRILGAKARELGITKALIVTDEGVVQAGAVDKARQSLLDAGIPVVVFDKVNPNPLDIVCEAGGELAVKEKVDGVIAVGGGSVIDCAKTVNILTTNPAPVAKYYRTWGYKKAQPLILVPTTSGTGSENTIYAVISDHETHAKNVTLAKGDLAICDPELTYTVPRDLTASTGMDAFAHAAESLTGNIRSIKTDVLAVDAIKRIVKWLPVAYQEPTNERARYEMMIASNFAGISFSDTLCHLGHATSHSAGVRLGVAHGISCAWALPETLAFVADAVPERVKMVADAMGIVYNPYITPVELGRLVADSIREFMRKLDIRSIKSYGFSRQEVMSVSDLVVQDVCFPIIPKPMTEADVKEFLGRVYDSYQ